MVKLEDLVARRFEKRARLDPGEHYVSSAIGSMHNILLDGSSDMHLSVKVYGTNLGLYILPRKGLDFVIYSFCDIAWFGIDSLDSYIYLVTTYQEQYVFHFKEMALPFFQAVYGQLLRLENYSALETVHLSDGRQVNVKMEFHPYHGQCYGYWLIKNEIGSPEDLPVHLDPSYDLEIERLENRFEKQVFAASLNRPSSPVTLPTQSFLEKDWSEEVRAFLRSNDDLNDFEWATGNGWLMPGMSESGDKNSLGGPMVVFTITRIALYLIQFWYWPGKLPDRPPDMTYVRLNRIIGCRIDTNNRGSGAVLSYSMIDPTLNDVPAIADIKDYLRRAQIGIPDADKAQGFYDYSKGLVEKYGFRNS